MTTSLTFTDDLLKVRGLSLTAPLAEGGQSQLWTNVKALTHDQLEAIAEELALPLHGLLPTDALQLMVGSELQLAWFEKMGRVPANVAKNHEERRGKFESLVKNLKEGKEMTKKAKKAAKQAKGEGARGHLYEVSAKEPKELKGQAELVYEALKKVGPAQPAVISAALSKEKLKTKQAVEKVVAFYLVQFKKAGYVKTSKAPTTA